MAQDLHGGATPRPDGPPARRMVPRRPLICVRRTRLWVIRPEIVTVVIHWDGARSWRCGFDRPVPGPCIGHEEGYPLRVQNWIQVQDLAQRRPVTLFQITPMALLDCPAFDSLDGVLPGAQVETWREKDRATGRMRLALVRSAPLAVIPETEPTLVLLEKLWSAPTRKVRVDRPRLWPDRPQDAVDPVGEPTPEEWEEGHPHGA